MTAQDGAPRRAPRVDGARNPVERVEVHPLDAGRWDDLCRLFGERGADGGCWCMYHRLTGRQFGAGTRDGGSGNREAFAGLVRDGRTPGLLAYLDGRPVGWVAVAPRTEFGRVQRALFARARPDADGVWSIVCFFVERSARRGGVAGALVRAAVAHARSRGAAAVEAYPVDPAVRGSNAGASYVGVVSMFGAEGFEEVARPYPARPLMRRALRQDAREQRDSTP